MVYDVLGRYKCYEEWHIIITCAKHPFFITQDDPRRISCDEAISSRGQQKTLFYYEFLHISDKNGLSYRIPCSVILGGYLNRHFNNLGLELEYPISYLNQPRYLDFSFLRRTTILFSQTIKWLSHINQT